MGILISIHAPHAYFSLPTGIDICGLYLYLSKIKNKNMSKRKSIQDNLSLEVFESIVVTSLSAASRHWYILDEVELSEYFNTDTIEPKLIAEALFTDPTFKLSVYDVENDEVLLGYCSGSSIEQALNGDSASIDAILDGSYDMSDADSIFQMAVMGEVVFG